MPRIISIHSFGSFRSMLKYITLATQLFFIMCDSKLEPLPRNQMKIRKSLSQCITETSKRFFNKEFETVTFSIPLAEPKRLSPIALDVFTLPELSKLENADIMIIRLGSLKKTWEKIKTIIIHFRNKEDMLDHLTKLKENKLLNSYAKYLLVSTVVFGEPFHVAEIVSKYMWTENVINFVVMIANPINTTQFIVYTWNPYSNNCGTDFSRSTHSTDYCSYGKIQSDRDWFGDKIPKKLSNCTVKAKYWDFPPYVTTIRNKLSGIEINILEIIGNQLNLKLSFNPAIKINKNTVSERHNAGENLSFLKSNDTDIFFGGVPRTTKISRFFPTSRSHMQDTLIWCVPNEPLKNDLENFITVISYKALFVTLLFHIVTSFFIWFLSKKTNKETSSYKNFFEVYFNTFGLLAGSSVPKQPQTVKVRYFLILLLFFSFILDSYYNSLLTRNITRPQFKEKYTSMKDIYDNNLKTYFIPEQKTYFKADIFAVPLNEIMQKWRDCFDIRVCLKYVSEDMDSSICLTKLFKSLILSNHTLDSIYCMEADGISYPVTMVMREGFPFYQRFDDIIKRMIAGGFIVKWENDFVKEIHKPLHHTTTGRIHFKNLLPVFQIYFIASAAATLIFVVEKLCYNPH
ncbi:unnamed protein product [Phaedon cochleariae]|uniref:Ionotropic receptor n=1 Tax=Phaedon cochleariae TaxID=80249 RepID=A0A9P0D8F1_PHACE|nr:unnamed protein product [Phaedon cochleariae]